MVQWSLRDQWSFTYGAHADRNNGAIAECLLRTNSVNLCHKQQDMTNYGHTEDFQPQDASTKHMLICDIDTYWYRTPYECVASSKCCSDLPLTWTPRPTPWWLMAFQLSHSESSSSLYFKPLNQQVYLYLLSSTCNIWKFHELL